MGKFFVFRPEDCFLHNPQHKKCTDHQRTYDQNTQHGVHLEGSEEDRVKVLDRELDDRRNEVNIEFNIAGDWIDVSNHFCYYFNSSILINR